MDLANMIKTIADLGEAKRKRFEVTKIGDRNYLLDHEAGTCTQNPTHPRNNPWLSR